MKKIFYVLILTILSTPIYSQTPSKTIFSNGDKIWVETTKKSEYHYVHKMEKGHSLYALSKVFSVSLIDIYKINNIKDASAIDLGQEIKIPLKDDYLFKGSTLNGLLYGHYIPVYYQTKPKDNLFRISRIYFDQPIEDLKKRNNLTSNNLELSQNILIGWLPIDSAEPRIQEDEFEEDLSEDELEDKVDYDLMKDQLIVNQINSGNDSLLSITLESPIGFNKSLLGDLPYATTMKEIKRSEVANWDKTMPDNGTVYVLHKDAIIDSYIEMYNPNLKRSVRAKVIGRIPYGAYTKSVCLVLSPRTAKQLGALDKRFKVEINALVFEVE